MILNSGYSCPPPIQAPNFDKSRVKQPLFLRPQKGEKPLILKAFLRYAYNVIRELLQGIKTGKKTPVFCPAI